MTRQTRRLLGAATLTGAVFLTGCTPAGDPGAAAGVLGCDPSGFGPLSGCGSTQNPGTTSQNAGTSSQDGGTAGRDELNDIADSVPLDAAEPEPACPAELYAEFDYDTGRVTHTDPPVSAACVDALNAENAEVNAALDAGPPARDWTVTQTVLTGPGQCVIGLDEIGDDDHHNRRVTTPEDCAAHPPGSTYHTGGAP